MGEVPSARMPALWRVATAQKVPIRGGKMAGSRMLRGMAGAVILISLFLHWKLDGADLMRLSWLWLTGIIGLSLFQSMF